MTVSDSQEFVSPGETPAAVRWSLAAGFFAWILDQGLSYLMSPHSCSTGHHYILHVITWVCFVVALTGVYAGWTAARKLPHDKKEEGRRPPDRAHFQSLLGMIFSASFAVVIIALAVPKWILSPCD
jgi:hypothetical protein